MGFGSRQSWGALRELLNGDVLEMIVDAPQAFCA
jgi:hypothetical protein